MAATVLPANSAIFGISGTGTNLFQSRSVTTKFDKKEANDNQGECIGWAFYGKMAEHNIETLGTGATVYTMGVAATAPTGITAAVSGTIFCVDEVSITRDGEDYAKSNIKVSEYVIED